MRTAAIWREGTFRLVAGPQLGESHHDPIGTDQSHDLFSRDFDAFDDLPERDRQCRCCPLGAITCDRGPKRGFPWGRVPQILSSGAMLPYGEGDGQSALSLGLGA